MGCINSSEKKEKPKENNEVPNAAPASKPSSVEGSGQEQFMKDALAAHNRYRSQHHAPAMRLNSELCAAARQYAEVLAKSGDLKHSSRDERALNGSSVGENLALNYGDVAPSGDSATKMWYDEVEKYDFGSPGFAMGTGHFTQVVWKDSTELGIGFAEAEDSQWGKRIVTVGRYLPAGNVTNQFPENVLEK